MYCLNFFLLDLELILPFSCAWGEYRKSPATEVGIFSSYFKKCYEATYLHSNKQVLRVHINREKGLRENGEIRGKISSHKFQGYLDLIRNDELICF